tara:strand:- start:271 stop:513 length:243 start_codon:yes stop_codon:yes gene_type:complete
MAIRSKKPKGAISTSFGFFTIGDDMFLSPDPTPEQEAILLRDTDWFEKAERPKAAPKPVKKVESKPAGKAEKKPSKKTGK